MFVFSRSPILALAALICGAWLALGPARADQTDPRLDDLFAQLQEEGMTKTASQPIQQRIWDIWTMIEDPKSDSLMALGVANMAGGDYEGAVRSFTALIEREPEFAEAWNKRATVLFLMGDYEASIADIRRTLALEPRHFGALSGLGLILYRLDEYKKAIAAYEAALEVNPFALGASESLEHIRKLEKGQPT